MLHNISSNIFPVVWDIIEDILSEDYSNHAINSAMIRDGINLYNSLCINVRIDFQHNEINFFIDYQ